MKENAVANRYKIHVGDDGALYFRSVHRLSDGAKFHRIAFEQWRALHDAWHGEPIFLVKASGEASPLRPRARKFADKHRALRETKRSEVQLPDQVWLSYAVCGLDSDSCGWSGWIIEGLLAPAKKSSVKTYRKGVVRRMGSSLVLRSADDDQICPTCDRQLFRTAVKRQLFSRSRS